jgi:hypothetical protein
METKYFLKFVSWKTGELTETGPHTFDDMLSLFHLHVHNGEKVSIHAIQDNGDEHREQNSKL